MSFHNKKWRFAESAPPDFLDKNYSNFLRQILWNRGVESQHEAEAFLDPSYAKHLHNPALLKDANKAAKRIKKAIENKEKIVIYGDYDADGVCASTVLKKVFEKLGAENLEVYIPHREKDGYGLNMEAVEEIAKNGANVMVTVDCGSTNIEEAKLAKKLGMDLVVTDHHQITEKNNYCYALVNPHQPQDKYPFKDLSGTAVAFKVAQVLLSKFDKESLGIQEEWEKWLLDLVAIATVADVMPLREENRVFVKYGLVVLQKTRWPGLRALTKKAGVKNPPTSFDIGFVIAPRINAAGRMDDARLAFNLLNEEDSAKAQKLAKELEEKNKERKTIVSKIVTEIEGLSLSGRPVIFEGRDNWPIGVLGIVAGRLAEKYNRPSFIYQKKEKEFVGSARTPENFDTVDILKNFSTKLTKFGGHKQAGGFTALLEKENDLAEGIDKHVSSYIEVVGEENLQPSIFIDYNADIEDINWNTYSEIQKLEPYGEGNEEPVFALQSVKVENPQMVGQDNNHFKCAILNSETGERLKVIGFNFPNALDYIKNSENVDIAFTLHAEQWNGTKELSLKLRDIRTN